MATAVSVIGGQPHELDSVKRPQRGYEKLTERLNDFIVNGKFSAGSKLPSERALAEQFAVSRSSVREAIRTLAEKGLLESRHGDGTYVCTPDMTPLQSALLAAVDVESKQFDHAMEFRRIFGPVIAILAAARCTPEQLNKLKLITCDQQRRILREEDDGELDAAFHLALAEATGNPLFVEMMRLVNEYYAKGRTPELRDLEWKNWSVTTHLMIIDAIERKEPESCREIMQKHLETVVEKHLFGTMRDK
jgi:GntR family transcriptional repressor for pyruvate dehydrogenase complex